MTATLFSQADHRFMAEAIRLAQRGLYTCAPNPRVGCVIVADGHVVGRGWHQVAGQGHAEVNALKAAGIAAKGATVYVSLEPCSHQGKTPPCADGLIAAGVKRVVFAMEDPNPQVAGRGQQKLQAAGIVAEGGLMSAQAAALNPGFVKRMRTGIPWVTVKTAMSVDGRIAMASGESQWVTGAAARRDVQRWRARSSAIVTGVGTVLADDPALTVRTDQWSGTTSLDEFKGTWYWPLDCQPQQPLRVIVDSDLRTPPQAKLFLEPGRTLMVCRVENPQRSAALKAVGADILCLPDSQRGVALEPLLRYLAAQEINEVLVEAGGTLAGSFVAQDLVDQWLCYMAPKLLGSQAQPALKMDHIERMAQAKQLELVDLKHFDQDLRMTYQWSR